MYKTCNFQDTHGHIECLLASLAAWLAYSLFQSLFVAISLLLHIHHVADISLCVL
jgi:hypothetical protein